MHLHSNFTGLPSSERLTNDIIRPRLFLLFQGLAEMQAGTFRGIVRPAERGYPAGGDPKPVTHFRSAKGDGEI